MRSASSRPNFEGHGLGLLLARLCIETREGSFLTCSG
jgi:hypothetical protein